MKFRKHKNNMRKKYLPKTITFEDPATKEEHIIDANKLRKELLDTLMKPMEGDSISSPIKNLMHDHFVKERQEKKKKKYENVSEFQ